MSTKRRPQGLVSGGSNAWNRPLSQARKPSGPPPGMGPPLAVTPKSFVSSSQPSAAETLDSHNRTARLAVLRERFLHLTLNLVGQRVTVTQTDGSVLEGVLHTFTPFPNQDEDVRNMYVVKSCRELVGPAEEKEGEFMEDGKNVRPHARVPSGGGTVLIPAERVSSLRVASLRLDAPGGPSGAVANGSKNDNGGGGGGGGSSFRTDTDISGGRGGRSGDLVAAGSAWTSAGDGEASNEDLDWGGIEEGPVASKGTVGKGGAGRGVGNSRADGLMGVKSEAGSSITRAASVRWPRAIAGPSANSRRGSDSNAGASVGGGLKGSIGTWDQFSANEQLFNVKANFDESLYTTDIDHSKLDANKVREAERLAKEIEGQVSTNLHIAEERGQKIEGDFDEEDLYSGVLEKEKTTVSSKESNGTTESNTDEKKSAVETDGAETLAVIDKVDVMAQAKVIAKEAKEPKKDTKDSKKEEKDSKKEVKEPKKDMKDSKKDAKELKKDMKDSKKDAKDTKDTKKDTRELKKDAKESKKELKKEAPEAKKAIEPVGPKPKAPPPRPLMNYAAAAAKARTPPVVPPSTVKPPASPATASAPKPPAVADEKKIIDVVEKTPAATEVAPIKEPVEDTVEAGTEMNIEMKMEMKMEAKSETSETKTDENIKEPEEKEGNVAAENAIDGSQEMTEKPNTVVNISEAVAEKTTDEDKKPEQEEKEDTHTSDVKEDEKKTPEKKVTSKLNPAAKAFTFNPSAKSFTPSTSAPAPPSAPQMPQHQIHVDQQQHMTAAQAAAMGMSPVPGSMPGAPGVSGMPMGAQYMGHPSQMGQPGMMPMMYPPTMRYQGPPNVYETHMGMHGMHGAHHSQPMQQMQHQHPGQQPTPPPPQHLHQHPPMPEVASQDGASNSGQEPTAQSGQQLEQQQQQQSANSEEGPADSGQSQHRPHGSVPMHYVIPPSASGYYAPGMPMHPAHRGPTVTAPYSGGGYHPQHVHMVGHHPQQGHMPVLQGGNPYVHSLYMQNGPSPPPVGMPPQQHQQQMRGGLGGGGPAASYVYQNAPQGPGGSGGASMYGGGVAYGGGPGGHVGPDDLNRGGRGNMHGGRGGRGRRTNRKNGRGNMGGRGGYHHHYQHHGQHQMQQQPSGVGNSSIPLTGNQNPQQGGDMGIKEMADASGMMPLQDESANSSAPSSE